jgi:transmembrane sensor
MNRQILEEASAWFVDFRVGDVDPPASAAFDEWLRRSPEHIRAYMDIARTYVDVCALGSEGRLDTRKLIELARKGENVIPLAPGNSSASTPAGRAEPHFRASRFRVRSLAAAIGALCLAVGIATWSFAQKHNTYATDVGEWRSITLADGSTIDLNARSKVRVTLSRAARDVELVEGEALFEVAKDRSRPFIVHSGTALVRAVGTQFTVYRKVSGTTVTVVEGRVAVLHQGPTLSELRAPDSGEAGAPVELIPLRTPGAGVSLPTLVSAGQQVTVTDDSIAAPVHADVAAATAWIQHRLIFDRSRLADVAEDFNRYNSRQLLVDDAALEDFHISGAYSSTDPASLLRFLREQPGIQVIETDDAVHITRK